MWQYIICVGLLLWIIAFCCFGFEKSMGLCIGFWSDKQYRILKIVCAIIGCCFLVALVLLCILSPNRFSEKMMKQAIIIDIAGFITMGLYIFIVYFIAWIGTRKELENKIRKCINNYKDYYDDNKKLLEIIIFVNQDYPKKTIKKIFFKIIKQNNGQLEEIAKRG